MLLNTNFKHARWFVVIAEEKNTAHIALITHLLKKIKYSNKNAKSLLHQHDLIYSATPVKMKEKLL